MDRFESDQGPEGAADRVDLSQFVLPVLEASDAERTAHEQVLGDIDKASGGKTVWRAVMA
jgi:DNA polymerase III subunit epsilon